MGPCFRRDDQGSYVGRLAEELLETFLPLHRFAERRSKAH